MNGIIIRSLPLVVLEAALEGLALCLTTHAANGLGLTTEPDGSCGDDNEDELEAVYVHRASHDAQLHWPTAAGGTSRAA